MKWIVSQRKLYWTWVGQEFAPWLMTPLPSTHPSCIHQIHKWRKRKLSCSHSVDCGLKDKEALCMTSGSRMQETPCLAGGGAADLAETVFVGGGRAPPCSLIVRLWFLCFASLYNPYLSWVQILFHLWTKVLDSRMFCLPHPRDCRRGVHHPGRMLKPTLLLNHIILVSLKSDGFWVGNTELARYTVCFLNAKLHLRPQTFKGLWYSGSQPC